MNYDFCGWATKNDLKCSDGRTIRKNAFAANDGKKVPLVFQHNHSTPSTVLGHAILQNKEEGVYVYGYLNETESGKNAKELLKHGDITSLSIEADQLIHDAGYGVTSGNITEVSLVIAGANPGAFIESVLAHGTPIDDGEDSAIIYTGESILVHAADDSKKDDPDSSGPKKDGGDDTKEKTPAEILASMTEEQKKLVGILVEEAGKKNKDEPDSSGPKKDGGDDKMKHSVFNQEEPTAKLTSDDMKVLLSDAKRLGSLKEAIVQHMADENSALRHAIDTTGMETATGTQAYGFNDPSMLFPEPTVVNGSAPEFISRNMAWVTTVLSKVSKSPFARIKTVFADITEDEARAKGYIKGKQKKEEVFALLKRKTEPQTIYKKQKLDRDDIIDIIEFDVLAWIKAEMEVMMDEEKARAILIGDGRLADSEDKILEDKVRPIATDVALFNTQVEVSGSNAELAKNFIYSAVKARKNYKGSGDPDLFTTEDLLTEMLLLENKNGDRMYKTEAELATALRVKSIYTVEPMEGQKVGGKPLLGIIVNLIDYKIGSDKNGARTMFDQFDIDFNQQKYLLEERFSGALIKPFAALTFVGSAASDTSYSSPRAKDTE